MILILLILLSHLGITCLFPLIQISCQWRIVGHDFDDDFICGQAHGLLVAGAGNKVEDFGIGFYTKYGDGGVDISPIADLTKTEVFSLAAYLNVIDGIQMLNLQMDCGVTGER